MWKSYIPENDRCNTAEKCQHLLNIFAPKETQDHLKLFLILTDFIHLGPVLDSRILFYIFTLVLAKVFYVGCPSSHKPYTGLCI